MNSIGRVRLSVLALAAVLALGCAAGQSAAKKDPAQTVQMYLQTQGSSGNVSRAFRAANQGRDFYDILGIRNWTDYTVGTAQYEQNGTSAEVMASIKFTPPANYRFVLTLEDGNWVIDSIRQAENRPTLPTRAAAVPATAAPMAAPNAAIRFVPATDMPMQDFGQHYGRMSSSVMIATDYAQRVIAASNRRATAIRNNDRVTAKQQLFIMQSVGQTVAGVTTPPGGQLLLPEGSVLPSDMRDAYNAYTQFVQMGNAAGKALAAIVDDDDLAGVSRAATLTNQWIDQIDKLESVMRRTCFGRDGRIVPGYAGTPNCTAQ